MDIAATPLELYIGLAYIFRVHGLTTQTSTGRCPYELARHGPAPSLFPQLVPSIKLQQRAEATAIRQNVARQHRRRQFEEGEEVVAYDAHTKRSHAGRIKEVLGNNTYLVDIAGSTKHMSGDVISKSRVSGIADPGTPHMPGDVRKEVSAPGIAGTGAHGSGTRQGANGGTPTPQDEELDQDVETASISSESSVDSMDSVYEGNEPVVFGNAPPQPNDVRIPRRRRREAELLGRPLQQAQRLRPLERRINRQQVGP